MSNINPFTVPTLPAPETNTMPLPDIPKATATATQTAPLPTPAITPDTESNTIESVEEHEPEWKKAARRIELDDIEAEMNRQIDEYHAQEILAKSNNQNDSQDAEERAQAAATKINKSLRGKDTGMKSLERIGITATIAGVALYAIYAIPTIQWLLSVIGSALLIGGIAILGYLLIKDKNRQNKILEALKQGYEEADKEAKAEEVQASNDARDADKARHEDTTSD